MQIYAYKDPCLHMGMPHSHTGIYPQTLLKIAKKMLMGIPVCIRALSAYGDQHIRASSSKPVKAMPMARAVTTMTTGVRKRARVTRVRVTRAIMEISLKEEGDDGPPLAARVHKNQLLWRQQQQGQ
jgi:hypothetical protein